ncbi:MAG: L-seryl-tRNA(Sec) selenium transferase, partial [Xanthobacteraceae bacterium]|nr:L-seryl-tRNA(Sec) selenium transferase [Xanthobacteraceae bacterium]
TAASRLQASITAAVGEQFTVYTTDCASQIGSGALPLETVPSAGLAIRAVASRASGRALTALAASFRALPIPVIGRIEKDALVFDLRCLEDEAQFISNVAQLTRAKP